MNPIPVTIWAATRDTLYVLKPGHTTFQPYTASDGLHIGPFIDPGNNPNTTWITAIAAGHANEVFVGYYGYESDNPYQDTEAQKELGNADKVTGRPSDPGAGCTVPVAPVGAPTIGSGGRKPRLSSFG